MTTLRELSRLERIFGGAVPNQPRAHWFGGILVDISNSCAASTLSPPVCPGAFGQPGFGRCLCGGDPGGPDPGPQGAGYHRIDPDRALSVSYTHLTLPTKR